MGIPIKIVGSTKPSGTISITENGEYNVARYAMADVNVTGGSGTQETYEASIMFYTGGQPLQEAIEGIVLYRSETIAEPIYVERVNNTAIPIQLPAGGAYELEIAGDNYDANLPPSIAIGFEWDEDYFSIQCSGTGSNWSFVMPAHDILIDIQGGIK